MTTDAIDVIRIALSAIIAGLGVGIPLLQKVQDNKLRIEFLEKSIEKIEGRVTSVESAHQEMLIKIERSLHKIEMDIQKITPNATN